MSYINYYINIGRPDMIWRMILIQATNSRSHTMVRGEISKDEKSILNLIDGVMVPYLDVLFGGNKRIGKIFVKLRECLDKDKRWINLFYFRVSSLYNSLILLELFELLPEMERLNAIMSVQLRASFGDIDDTPLRSLEKLKEYRVEFNGAL